MLRVGRVVIVGRVRRLAIVALRVVIGLPAMVNVVRSRRVAMRRVVRAAIAGRVLPLVIVALRAVIGLPAMVNAVRTRRVAMLRVVRAAIAVRVLPLATVALRVATGLPAMVNAVRTRRVAMLRVVRAAIVARVRPLATVALRAAIGLPAMANAVRSRRVAMLRVVRAATVARVRPLATAALRAAIALPAMANAVRSRRVAMLREARAAIAAPSFGDRAPARPSATAAPRAATVRRATPNAVRSSPATTRAVRAAIARRARRSMTAGDRGAPRERNHAHDGSPRPAPTDRQRPSGDSPYAARDTSGRFGDERKPAARKPVSKPSKPRDADAPPSPARIARENEEGLVRLSKVMSELGLCSRREADEWIEKGWVLVDGEVIDTLGTKIRPDQNVEIAPAAHAAQMQQVTILIHKPVGYVSGQAEDGYQPAVTLVNPSNHWADDQSGIRFTPLHLRTLAPAGRLDIDSTGLLVLTQDGRVAKQLIGGHSDVDKEYLVRVKFGEHEVDIEPHFPPESLALLRHGLSLDDVPLKTAQVSWQNGEQLRFVLREGKKRQIRRMCELVGLEVVGLKRIRMGRVTLGALPPGQWRYLGADEAF